MVWNVLDIVGTRYLGCLRLVKSIEVMGGVNLQKSKHLSKKKEIQRDKVRAIPVNSNHFA